MRLYNLEFDATAIFVIAEDEEQLLNLLHEKDASFQKEKDGGIIYIWDSQNIEEVHVEVVNLNRPGIIYSCSH